ncbi:MAG: LysR family transcriptional regulator [Burkholderiales bacterium]|nr:MAG: LysR family transcriptional regulator [Burkholderiales bacterium]
MDVSKVDLNLLGVFAALYEHQNVTRAGAAIGLSQPAMSAALAKARVLFGDVLFVRTAGGMKPTARAEALAEPVRRVLDAVRNEVLQVSRFDPQTTTRTFTIVMPDIGEVAFLPKLLARLNRETPNANVRTLAMPPAAIERAMELGVADLALGLFPDLTKAGFYQQRLFRNSFICVVSADHPQARDALPLRRYLDASHAVVRPEGRTQDLFERELQKRGYVRRVRLETPHYLSLPTIIADSDLIATVPRDIGVAFAKQARIRLLEPPLKVVFDVKQYWHERAHKDPVNVWLRRLVNALFHD